LLHGTLFVPFFAVRSSDILLSLTEGLGRFPTSHFQPKRERGKGENTEVGTHFLSLPHNFIAPIVK
jgi:hypothetical protein